MVLDWLSPARGNSVADLIARKRYAQAIVVLREQFRGRAPDSQTRLQLADLLVLSGRREEAVPILLGLADEFAADGFVAKAIAILKRIDRIEPKRADVETRLESLVRRQYRTAPARAPAQRLPEFGIEEIVEPQSAPVEGARQPADADVEASGAPPGEPAAAPAVSEGAAPEPPASEVAAPAPEPPAPTATAPEGDAREPAAGPGEPAPAHQGVAGRIKGLLGRLLASRAEAHPAPAAATAPTVTTPTEGERSEPGLLAPAAGAESSVSVTPAAIPEGPAPAVSPSGVASERQPAQEPVSEPAVAPAQATHELPPVLAGPDVAAREVPSAETPEPQAPVHGMAHRIKSLLGRLLASHGDAEEAPPTEGAPTEGQGADVSPGQAAPTSPEGELVEVVDETSVAVVQAGGTEGSIEPEFVEVVDETVLAEPPVRAEAAAPEPVPEVVEATVLEAEAAPRAAPATSTDAAPEAAPMSEETFQDRLLDVIEEVLHHPPPAAAPAPLPAEVPGDERALLATPLFGELSEQELLAVVRRLRLRTFEAGEIVVTEGEVGDTLFIVASGTVKVFIRNRNGRDVEVRELREGDFFGENSLLSGRPRTATITAGARCELFELDRPTLGSISKSHPGVLDTLEAFFIERVNSPEAAVIRAASMNDPETQQRAIEVLKSHFGNRSWDPRMRLKLADVLLKAERPEDAVPILVDLADELARQGFPEKAIAILKKVERIEGRHTEQINLAPLRRQGPDPGASAPPGDPIMKRASTLKVPPTEEFFQGWLVDVVRDTVRGHPPVAARTPSSGVPGDGRDLGASPLFGDFSEPELLSLIEGLRLLSYDPGDVIISEGEPGNSVFIVATGAVRVFVRNPAGRNVEVCELGESEFFGEISTLSGRPRSATVTASLRCELLELDKSTLDSISQAHPRVRAVLEEYYVERASSPYAASIRSVDAGR